MTITKKVGTKSHFGKVLWTYAMVYILLISALLAVTTSVMANNPPGVDIVAPVHESTVSGNVTVWIVAWDPDGNDQIQEVWVQIDGGDLLNATYNHTDAEGQWWYFVWDTTTVEDGWHSIKAIAFDGVDEATDIIHVLVDNVPDNNPPEVEITHPIDGATVSGTVNITIRGSDADGPDDVEMVFIKIDNGSWEHATFFAIDGGYSWWYFLWDTTLVEDGWHHITARAWDGMEHSADFVIEIIVDNVPDNNPPEVEITHPIGGVTVSGTVNITIRAYDADGPDDIEMVFIKIDDGSWQHATFFAIDGGYSWWYFLWDTTLVEDGWHLIRARAWDGKDHSADFVIEIIVDNVPDNNPPEVEITHPLGGDTVSGMVNITIRASDADGPDDIEMVFIEIDDGGWQHTTFFAIDGGYSWWYFLWDTTLVEDGWHHIRARAWDGMEHSADHVIEVIVDNVPENNPPEVEITHPVGGATVSGTVNITIRAYDADGPEDIEMVFIKIDEGSWHEASFAGYDGGYSWWYFLWDTTTVEDGWHHIRARAWDGTEHSPDHVIEVFVDNVPENNPPGIEIVEPAGGSTVSGTVTIWMVAWDPDGNDQILDVWVKIDGGVLQNATYNHTNGEGQWWYFEWDTTTVEDGWHHVKAITFDGIDDASDLIEVLVDNIPDNNRPEVDIVEPANGETVSGVIEVWIKAWDADGPDDIEMVWVKIDDGSWHEATFFEIEGDYSWWVFEWDTTTVEDGEHHIRAKAWDGEEHSEVDVIYVIVDNNEENSPPGIEIVEPEDGATLSGLVEILMVAWDPDGHDEIEMVWVKIDNGAWNEATFIEINGEGSWWSFEWDTTTVEDGWHHIYAKTTDGHLWADDHIEVYVNNEVENHPPYIEIMEPEDGDTVSGIITIWMVAWDADGLDDIENVWVKIDDGSMQDATFHHIDGMGSWWFFEWDTTSESDGWHLIRAIVYDGKDDGHDLIEVYVENGPGNSPPHVDIVEPENSETVWGVIEIWVKAWDADGREDVEMVFIKIDDGSWHEATFVEYEGDYSWWVMEWDTTTVENGWHHIYAKAWDGEDHSGMYVIEVYVQNEEENHAPGIDITSPEDGATVSGVIEILMVAWDPDGHEEIEMVWVRIDEGEWQEATFVEINGEGSWWVFEWDTTTVEDGWHHIKAKTTDGLLWADDHIEVFVDNEGENSPPGIEITDPLHGSTVSGTVTIWMVAWDPDGNEQIQDVWVRIDGGDLRNATYDHTDAEGQWWYYEWDTTEVEDGWHWIKAIVFDGIDDGHDVIEIIVDNVPENSPPHVDIISPEHSDTVFGVIEVEIKAWDEDGVHDIEKVYVRIDGGSWEEATFIAYEGDYSYWVFEWDTTTVEDGEHHIYAKAWDGKDHSEEDVIMVIVDNSEGGESPWMSDLLPLLLVAAILAVAAMAFASTEVGTMALMSLIFLPLYTKISKKDVLDHFVRGQIFGYIKVNPGDNYTTIKKNLDLNNGTLTYHLNVLEKEGLIKSWTNGSHKYFYPMGVKIPGNGVKNPSIHDAILKSIRDSPGISVSDIAAVNGISKQLANYHIRKMAAEGTIELERKSFSKLCYPKAAN